MLGTRIKDSRSVSIKIVILKEDKDDSKIRELFKAFYIVKEQFKQFFVDMSLLAGTLSFLVAFVAFDIHAPPLNQQQLPSLSYYNLTGANVIDYVNPMTHKEEYDQLLDFVLERLIPAKSADDIEAVCYMGKQILHSNNTF